MSSIRRLATRPGLILFAFALAVRLAWVLTFDNSLAWPDEKEFVEIARHFAGGEGITTTNSYRANPVLPVYLGTVFSIFGEGYLVARIGQAMIGALTCTLIYLTGAVLIGPAAGILAGLLLAVYVPHVYLSGVFYAECLFTFFIALSIYLAVRGIAAKKPLALAILCGLSCGVTVLTRSVFATYLPVLCAAWIYAGWPHWRKQIPACAALILASATVILPWTWRNYAVYGRIIPVSSGFYTTLWQGNNVLSNGDAGDRFLFWDGDYWAARLDLLEPGQQEAVRARYADIARRTRTLQDQTHDRYLAADVILKPVVIDSMTSDPWRTLSLSLRKVRTLFSAITPTDTGSAATSPRQRRLAAVAFYPLLALAIVGACLGIRGPRGLSLIYGLFAAMVGTYALLTACARFRLPLDPYLILFGSWAMVRAVLAARAALRLQAGASFPSQRLLGGLSPRADQAGSRGDLRG